MDIKRKTEIEIRGKLDENNFNRVFTILKKEGKIIANYKRLSVDLSPGFDPKTRTWSNSSKFDLRVKKSGNSEKISIKIGQFHLKKRREIEVKLEKGEFLDAIALLESLGFNKGMTYFWESWEFNYRGYEVKLSKYTEDYFTWEIETTNHKLDPYDLTKSLNIIPYTKQGYNLAINWENKHIHKIYSYKLAEKLLKEF